MVEADIALIERVLENLIDNALSHSPDGGAIRILIASDGHSVRVTVSDSGPGIAPEHLPRVFDHFYRAGNAHRGDAHAGLGLAIAKRIVELHGARLEVESALGRGTAFSFRLANLHYTSARIGLLRRSHPFHRDRPQRPSDDTASVPSAERSPDGTSGRPKSGKEEAAKKGMAAGEAPTGRQAGRRRHDAAFPDEDLPGRSKTRLREWRRKEGRNASRNEP